MSSNLIAWSTIYGRIYSGSDVTSQSMVMQLNSSDTVNLYLVFTPLYSENNYQTALPGFLSFIYIWTKSCLDSYLFWIDIICTVQIVINFTSILLNEENVWKAQTSSVNN